MGQGSAENSTELELSNLLGKHGQTGTEYSPPGSTKASNQDSDSGDDNDTAGSDGNRGCVKRERSEERSQASELYYRTK